MFILYMNIYIYIYIYIYISGGTYFRDKSKTKECIGFYSDYIYIYISEPFRDYNVFHC